MVVTAVASCLSRNSLTKAESPALATSKHLLACQHRPSLAHQNAAQSLQDRTQLLAVCKYSQRLLEQLGRHRLVWPCCFLFPCSWPSLLPSHEQEQRLPRHGQRHTLLPESSCPFVSLRTYKRSSLVLALVEALHRISLALLKSHLCPCPSCLCLCL